LSELPFVPYEGSEPYIFVSYTHKNWDKVKPILVQLHGQGYRLWWDEGIVVGDEWPATIYEHLSKASCMLLFLTSKAVASKWVQKEINVAVKQDIHIAGTFLVKTELPAALKYQLSDVQMLFYEQYRNNAAYLMELRQGLPGKTKVPEQKFVPKPEATSIDQQQEGYYGWGNLPNGNLALAWMPDQAVAQSEIPSPFFPSSLPESSKKVNLPLLESSKSRGLLTSMFILHAVCALTAIVVSICLWVFGKDLVSLSKLTPQLVFSLLLIPSFIMFSLLYRMRVKPCLTFLGLTLVMELSSPLWSMTTLGYKAGDYAWDVPLFLFQFLLVIGALTVSLLCLKPIKTLLEVPK